MTPAALVKFVRNRGASLEVRNGDLWYSGPPLRTALRNELGRHTEELIAHLKRLQEDTEAAE